MLCCGRNLFCAFQRQYSRKYLSSSVPWEPEHLARRYKQKILGKTPRRAVLYVPGNDEKKIKKIQSLKVDCAVLDCEDGVAVNRKSDARNTIKQLLPYLIETISSELCVRVNSVSSGIMEEDATTIFSSEQLPQAVMLPKVEHWTEIKHFFEVMTPLLKNVKKNMKLVIFIETATGLVNLQKIIESTIAHSAGEKVCLTFEGIVFGSDDFCASIGVERTKESTELFYARQKIVAYAKAYNLQAIDMVYIDYKDNEGLEKQSLEGASYGFTGKQIIHPGQIEIVQKCFSPSEEKLNWATELVSSFEKHQELGQGAFTFRGQMIDMPLLKQAKSILDMK